MKEILLVITLAIGLQAGGMWDMVKNSGLKEITPISSYVIGVQGVDIRGYTFIPDNMPDTRCVMVFTDRNFQMSCSDIYKNTK